MMMKSKQFHFCSFFEVFFRVSFSLFFFFYFFFLFFYFLFFFFVVWETAIQPAGEEKKKKNKKKQRKNSITKETLSTTNDRCFFPREQLFPFLGPQIP